MLFDAAKAYRDGTGSFAAFALECAHTATLARDYEEGRDKSDGYTGFLSAEYKDDTSRPVIERLRAELAEVQSWDKATAKAKAQASFDEALAKYQQDHAQYQAQQERYKAMRAEVEAWRPPTPQHDGVKRHMLLTITDDERNQLREPFKPSAPDWKWFKDNRIKSLTYAIDELTKIGTTVEEQRQRHEEWMRHLRESLGLPATEAPQQ